MGGHMQQTNAAAAAAFYDHAGALQNASAPSDAGDAVMARWLQSAGLQHLASPLASTGIDQRALPNLLMQGYGAQSAEEKQRLFKLMRNLNFNGESGSEPYTPTAQTSTTAATSDGFYSPDFRGDFGAGLLDLHAMDDTELLSEVRKRPLNKKELAKKEDDVVYVSDNSLTVHEPKLKVDLTAYVEKHEFCFDAVLDEDVNNDKVYRDTVEPIIPTIFQKTKATCFAYGQTGSGKTYTMQPLPLRAAQDMVRLLHQPVYRTQKFKLWLSYFEIYGGKLFDLLSERKKLCMREDGRQQVCIVGLQEFEVLDVQIVKDYIEKGNAARSTGSTGANEESSRSHAILQLVIKKHKEVKETRRNNNIDVNEAKHGKLVGKISFIDLAGSERGADTTDNDRQTRIEGAEINKSLLALKECIRALDNEQIHIPFRGSKLTEVLRDSFVGNSRTVMISCISPNAGSCEHTLNTLRYADRVKSLSKGSNTKKDQIVTSSTNKDVPPSSALDVPSDIDDMFEQREVARAVDMARRFAEKESASYNPVADYDRQESGSTSSFIDRDRTEVNNSYNGPANTKSYSQTPVDVEEKVPKVSPPRRKVREEKTDKSKKELVSTADVSTANSRPLSTGNHPSNIPGPRHQEPDPTPDGNINAILKVRVNEMNAWFSSLAFLLKSCHQILKLYCLAFVGRRGSNYSTPKRDRGYNGDCS
ncbi:Kinesin-like protein KIN-13A [Linum perenne]